MLHRDRRTPARSATTAMRSATDTTGGEAAQRTMPPAPYAGTPLSAMTSRMIAHLLILLIATVLAGCSQIARGPAGGIAARPTHGIAIGEVSPSAATVWVRCSDAVPVRLELDGGGAHKSFNGVADAARDNTARVRASGLTAATQYSVRVFCGGGVPITGRFATAPPVTAEAPVRVAWGGDVGGQNVCRDITVGYPIFSVIAAQRPDLFIGLGDMVYGDDHCAEIGRYGNRQVAGPAPARSVDDYRDHWKYTRGDPYLQHLLATVPYFTVWDDHEIRDDAGPEDDRPLDGGDIRLLPLASSAFADYQPWRDGRAELLFYRRIRWGRHLELFLLDTRSYRDRNDRPDTDIEPKTMLGARQRQWLLDRVAASDATWKVIVSSVPLGIPTGTGPNARDGWSDDGGNTGFEREAALLLDGMRAASPAGVIFLTADVHFATAFEYRPFVDAPGFAVHEFVTGPLHAGIFPRRDLDPTFSPRRLFLWHPTAFPIATYDDAIAWFNYGQIDIDGSGRMTVTFTNARGETVWQTVLERAD